MTRRLALLAALVLAACTADMPTEPESYAGPAFGTALPPVPTPPEALEATISGDGAPVLQMLGFYESPTLARVTVSGLLHYSGLGTGYYPGQSGTIDYQGRSIPGRCALNVLVYVQGSGPIGGTANCPSFWQSIGSQTTLSIVSGQVMVGRNAAAPGACFFGEPGPCAAISGEQTVTVTPIDGEARITVDRTSTYPGGIIGAKFTADPEWYENKQMPFTLRQVTFEGSGPILGGGTTTGCTSWSKPNECTFRLYQSGFLVVEAIVSGKLRTQRQWLVVSGGDSLPPQPPDTTPTDTIPTDTIPTDTIPGGGGGGGGCSAGAPLTSAGLYLACEEEGPPPSISLAPKIGFSLQTLPSGLLTSWGAPNSAYWGQLSDSTVIEAFVDSAGTPLQGRSVSVTLFAIDSAGVGSDASYGHHHSGGTDKLVGSFSTPQGAVTDSTGHVRIVFRSSIISGPVIVRAELSPSIRAEVTVGVGIPGLVTLTDGGAIDLIGSTPKHRENHYVTSTMRQKLDSLADTLFALYGVQSELNDASLQQGGKFDINGTWGGDHVEHRLGRDIDFRTFIWTEARLNRVKLLWQALGGTVHDETDTESPHYHLRYRGNE